MKMGVNWPDTRTLKMEDRMKIDHMTNKQVRTLVSKENSRLHSHNAGNSSSPTDEQGRRGAT